MNKNLISFETIATLALLAFSVGCASTQQTERMLGEAGFKRIVASTPQQEQHLKTLPTDKLTVARLKGKSFYVFPDPAHDLIYVGNLEEYQAYQQILLDKQIKTQNRVMGDLGEDTGIDSDNWSVWTDQTGWISGSD